MKSCGRSRALVLVLAVALATVTACGTSSSGSGAAPGSTKPASLTTVRWMLANPVMTLGHTQISVAQKQGYFTAEGVNFQLLTSQGTAAAVQAVAAGSADMAEADTLSVDTAATKGVTNVQTVCSYITDNIYTIAVLKSSSIKSVAQLKGKTIGVTSLATGVYYNAELELQQAGLSVSDVHFVVLGSSAALLHALSSGSVDAVAEIDVDLGTYKNEGVLTRQFTVGGATKYQWGTIVANTSFLAAHPAAVAGTCKAIQEGEYFALHYPTAAIADFEAEGNDINGLTPAQALNVLQSRSLKGFDPPSKTQWGWLPVSEMQPLAKLYQQLGLFPQAPDTAKLYTNRFVKEMQFNPSTIKPTKSKSSS